MRRHHRCYIPCLVMCDLYPQMLGKLDGMEDDSPKSSVTILAESQSLIVLMSYFVGPHLYTQMRRPSARWCR